MNEKLKDVTFINLPENRKIGDMVLKNNIPLPVVLPEDRKVENLDVNSVIAALIKVVAWDNESENSAYYREILLKMQPDVVKELNIAAIAKSNKNDYDFALELMLAVNHLSQMPESYVNLAVLYAKMTVDCHKKNKDAVADMYDDKILEILNECIKKHPSYAPAYSEISAFHMRHGNIDDARSSLETSVSLTTDVKEKQQAEKTLSSLDDMLSSQSQIVYAYDKMMIGCSDEAIKVINSYLEHSKLSWEAYFIRGWAKRSLMDFDGAQDDLLKSISIDSSNAEVYNELALCSKEKGDTELAKSYLQIACDLDSESAVYLTNLALLYMLDKEYNQAREAIEKARICDPNDPALKNLMQQYTESTGEEFSDIVKEEIYTDEQFEELHKQEHIHNHHHEEI